MHFCPQSRAYLRGGFKGFKPPPPEIFRFFLKSEGKEVERKRKKMKRDSGGGGGVGLIVNTFFGAEIFSSGVQIFSGEVEKFSGGLKNFGGGGWKIFWGG